MTELAESHWIIKRRCTWRATRRFLRVEAKIWCSLLKEHGFTVDQEFDDDLLCMSDRDDLTDRPVVILVRHKHRSAMTMFTLKHSCTTLLITTYSK
jgi:hypothetical protein